MRIYLFLLVAILTQNLYAQVKFDFQSDEYDFGTVEEGEVLSHTFEFNNTGNDTIQLKEESRDVRPGCSCTASEYSKDTIPPGGKGFIKAGYNTISRQGIFIKNITVSQKGTPYKILTIKGVVIKKNTKKPDVPVKSNKLPVLIIDSKSHDFGKNSKETKLLHKFTIKNGGKDTLKFINSYSACQCINYKLFNNKDLTSINYLLPGKTAFLEVSYFPLVNSELSDKKSNDKLTIFTNDPKNQKIELNLSTETQ